MFLGDRCRCLSGNVRPVFSQPRSCLEERALLVVERLLEAKVSLAGIGTDTDLMKNRPEIVYRD